MLAKIIATISMFLIATSCTSIKTKTSAPFSSNAPKNIVFMIVDGMGFEHVKAARIYNGDRPFSYEQFTCKTKVTTCSHDGADSHGQCLLNSEDVTDSAAAATAIATGAKVKNGVISRSIPKEHRDIDTILELSKRKGKSTGIVATKLFSDATPAAFVSHADDRALTEEILTDIFHASKPNVVFGADNDLHRQIAKLSDAPYQMVHSASELKNLSEEISSREKCQAQNCPYVYGGFGQHSAIPEIYDIKIGLPLEMTPATTFEKLGVPHLSEMTDAALKILSKNDDGFFLMVESSMPDSISHYNSQIDENEKSPKAVAILIREMLEVENTIKVIESFVANNPDTLLVLTADHETGGLVVDQEKTPCVGQDYCLPTVRWTAEKYEPTKDSVARHTAADVPLYATGRGAERYCAESINNIDIASLALAQ